MLLTRMIGSDLQDSICPVYTELSLNTLANTELTDSLLEQFGLSQVGSHSGGG